MKTDNKDIIKTDNKVIIKINANGFEKEISNCDVIFTTW